MSKIQDYQKLILDTAFYPEEISLAYLALGITGEAGEVSDKVKKLYRDKDLLNTSTIHEDDKESLVKELGDVLWYLTAIANHLGVTLSEIMDKNSKKLLARRATGTLSGSGDDRELTYEIVVNDPEMVTP